MRAAFVALAWLAVGLMYRTRFYDELAAASSALMLGGAVWALLWRPAPRWEGVRMVALVIFGQAFAVSGVFVLRDVDVRRLSFSPASDAFAMAVPMMLAFSALFVGGAAFAVRLFSAPPSDRKGALTRSASLGLAAACAGVTGAAFFARILPGGILLSVLFGANLVLPLLVASSCESEDWRPGPFALIAGIHGVTLLLTSMLGSVIVPAASVGLVLIHLRRWPSRSVVMGGCAVLTMVAVLNPAKGVFRTLIAAESTAQAAPAAADFGSAISTWDESIVRAWDPDRTSVGENTSSTMDRLDYNWALALVLSNVPAMSPFLYGATLGDLVEVATPRLINPAKGTTEHLHQRWMVQLGAQSTASTKVATIGVPVVAEAYWNWGWWGVGLVPLVMGAGFGGLLLLAPRTRVGGAAYVVLCCGFLPQLLDMMTWFICAMVVMAMSAGALRYYVRAAEA